MLNKKLSFSVDDFSIEDNQSSHFAILDMKIVSSGMNAHRLPITEDAIKNASSSLYGKPVLTHYIEEEESLGGHDPEEIPVGVFLNNETDITKEGDVTWLSAKAYVWKKYFPHVLEVFRKNDGKTNISMEIEVLDSNFESDGYEWIKEFSFLGVTAIGVTPAISGSGATVLQFSDLVDIATEEFSSRYASIDFTIPSAIKRNAQLGLDSYKEKGKGGTSVSLAMARYLVKSTTADSKRVRQMSKFFKSKIDLNFDDKTSPDWVGWQLRGGNEGRTWSISMSKDMDEADEKRASFFSNEEVFVYKSIGDINPALKGIKPPVSLSQANQIAKAADAIGSDKEKNGWAIAISNFKKTHTVKDGHWVAKEKQTSSEFAKEDMGKGSALKVDKSKDAMSTKAWGDVDKTTLRNKILNASNYKSLVKDVYMLVEAGWEDAPSSHLKYPVMELKGDTLVYNRYGLSAALQRATGQNESGVVSKVNGIYGKLGLDNNTEKAEFQRMEEASRMTKPKEEDKPKEDSVEEEKTESPEEEKTEDEKSEKFQDEAKEPAKEEVSETPEEEKSEGDDKEKTAMSMDAYADVPAMLGMIALETEKVKEMFAELEKPEGKDFAVISSGLYFMLKEFAKCYAAIQAKDSEKEEEFALLKKFKSDTEEKDFQQKVEMTLNEVKEYVSPEEYGKWAEEAKKFSLATISDWDRNLKASLFSAISQKIDKEVDEHPIIKMSLPFNDTKKIQNNIW